jgi:hypothetical protein
MDYWAWFLRWYLPSIWCSLVEKIDFLLDWLSWLGSPFSVAHVLVDDYEMLWLMLWFYCMMISFSTVVMPQIIYIHGWWRYTWWWEHSNARDVYDDLIITLDTIDMGFHRVLPLLHIFSQWCVIIWGFDLLHVPHVSTLAYVACFVTCGGLWWCRLVSHVECSHSCYMDFMPTILSLWLLMFKPLL